MSLKYFCASANTGLGFINNFKNLKSKDEFSFVIKGGSGTGKSSMLKRIGEHFAEAGHKVLFVHCSTDTKSFDAIKICDQNISVFDGTAPHVMEANLPQIEDKIINVGAFIKDDIKKHKVEAQKIVQDKAVCYQNVYRYLESAEKLFQINKTMSDFKEIDCDKRAKQIYENLGLKSEKSPVIFDDMFLSFLGENGRQNLIDENTFSKVVFLEENPFFASKVLEKANCLLRNNNISFVSFKNSLNSNFFEGVFIPQKDILLFVKPKWQNAVCLENNSKILELEKMASDEIKKAKILHKNLEQIYITHTNFKEIDKLTKHTIVEIEKMIKANKKEKI